MAKIRNVSGEDRFVPSLSRLVMDGQVIKVDPEQVYAFTQSAIWEAVDKEAKAAELEAEADYQSALAAANPELVTEAVDKEAKAAELKAEADYQATLAAANPVTEPDDAPDGTPTTDNDESQEG